MSNSINIFRSEEMIYMQSIIPEEVSKPYINNLANIGCTQLIDLNYDISNVSRRYMKDLIKIQDLERKINALDIYLSTYNIKYENYDITDELIGQRNIILDNSLELIEYQINNLYNEISENIRVVQEFSNSMNQAKEFVLVLSETGKMLTNRNEIQGELEDLKHEHENMEDSAYGYINSSVNSIIDRTPMLRLDSEHGPESHGSPTGLSYIAGIVSHGLKPTFERQLFFASRGNTLNFYSDNTIPGPNGAAELEMIPFVVYFLGAHLRRKITRICESMNVRLYIYPESSENLQQQQRQALQQVEQLTQVNDQSVNQLNSILTNVATRISSWKLFLIQEKTLATNLNKLRIQGPTMITQFWMPAADLPRVQDALDRATIPRGLVGSLTQLKTDMTPPTYFRPNGFTDIFQVIVNTYGVPRYQEVNPALFTIITFPFLFGIMFGDIGHGALLLTCGLLLCIFSESIKRMGKDDDSYTSMYNARYLILFMGVFAFYTGWIYNDCLSFPINLGSSYEFPISSSNVTATANLINSTSPVYNFGVDPIWADSNEHLQFQNSLKMKMAVIVGVIQMIFGLVLSVFNHIYFGNYISVYSEFIPQLIFILSLFGYMVLMILIKWSTDWSVIGRSPPNLITTMINMFLHLGVVDDADLLYEGQASVQTLLVILAGISVPWMLCMKPSILYYQLPPTIEEDEHLHAPLLDAKDGEKAEHRSEKHADHNTHANHPSHDFSEVVIHQMIHTIEYVLGTISNTASYLRLWALSLAHAELADVFWNKVLVTSWNTGSPFFVVVGFAMWLGATIGVLMCMDVLECFLHALRLHWVEFQNKFYNADGIAFQPFSYQAAIIDNANL